MTSREKYKITEEDIKKYDGEGMCLDLEECNCRCSSKVCGLIRGYKHPQCPVRIEIRKELLKDPKYVAEKASIHQVAEHARQLLKKLEAKKKEREGKKTE